MKNEALITKPLTGLIIKICFDVVEFFRLYDQDKSIQKIFECNEGIKKGLKWFVGSKSPQEMYDNIEAYIQASELTLEVYSNLNFSPANKEKMISTLKNLRSSLLELQTQIKQKI